MKRYYVYVVTNKWNTVLYVGVTGNLEGRVLYHKKRLIEGFTKRYHLTKLVYFEEYDSVFNAIHREKQLKNWHREWKMNLVKKSNPDFVDLAGGWFDNGDPETSSG